MSLFVLFVDRGKCIKTKNSEASFRNFLSRTIVYCFENRKHMNLNDVAQKFRTVWILFF